MKKISVLVLLMMCCFAAKAYWQQHTATTISVTLDDRTHFLEGQEEIIYTNNSPDTLRYIYVHLWPNAYKNDRTAYCEQQVQLGKTNFYYSSAADKGYIDSLRFSIDGVHADFNFVEDNPDIIRVELPKSLLPGAAMTIKTPFRVKIPKLFSRLGHNGQAYFISQWFPKPAVYDSKGWHPIPYLDQGEFYSEIGSYDVSITLPENYIVMATGNCQTPSEMNWLDSVSKLPLPKDTLYNLSTPPSSEVYKTIRFTEDNVHDFAWFADKRWILRQDTVSGEGNEGITRLYTAFLPKHQQEWANANTILKRTIEHYGTSVGKYPYKTMKAVEGDMSAGGGMEYPTVTIIDKNVASILSVVLVHEAGHNWFYGMLASNEREHPWMDEGINSFYEHQTSDIIKDPASHSTLQRIEDNFYYHLLSINQDQPSELRAEKYNAANYATDVYYKTSYLLAWLQAYMGEEDFKKAMHLYFNTWKFKHPYPEDFKAIMQAGTTKNLDWFFDHALYTDRKIDFKLQKVNADHGKLSAIIKNKSDFAAPVSITFFNRDTAIRSIWVDPFVHEQKVVLGEFAQWDKVKIDSVFVDYKLANNQYKRYGLFHKRNLKIHPVLGLNRNESVNIFISPAAGYNQYNGFQAGLLLHNVSFPTNRFQFAIAPLYSFGSQTISGTGAASYSWFPKRTFKEIRVQLNVKSFAQDKTEVNIDAPIYANYLKIAPSLELVFKEKEATSKTQHKLILKQYNISEQYFNFTRDLSVDSLYRPSVASQQRTYALIRYEYRNDRTFHPYAFNLEAQWGQNFIKLGLDAHMKINYDIKKKAFYIRGYVGKFINTVNTTDNSRYWLNTTYTGRNDYLMEGTYFGRNENTGFSARQISMQEGGFKIPTNLYATPLGRSSDWLMSLNLKTDLPFGKLPLRAYADFVSFANAKSINAAGNAISFNAGLELNLFSEMLSIYFPLLMSTDYSNYIKEINNKNRFLNSITFSLNIQNVNWLRTNERVVKLINP